MTALCRDCGSPIAFKKPPNGRSRPVEPDGSDHFDKCSARKWERLQRNGQRFESSDDVGVTESGYRLGDTSKRDYIRGKLIVGAQYRERHHRDTCTAAPWEECACP